MVTPKSDGRSGKAAKGKGASSQEVPQELTLIQPNAAGIDVGAEVHYVAVPEDRAQESVRRFGCYTQDLHALAPLYLRRPEAEDVWERKHPIR